MTPLKKCPFCNSVPELKFHKGEHFIQCPECPARMEWFAITEEAIAHWNKRCLTVFENEIECFTNGVEMTLKILENYKAMAQETGGPEGTVFLIFKGIIEEIETHLGHAINP